MPGRLKVVTVVGTRPEIIRLSRIIAALEDATDHILVHTGQNYDYELNEIFFDEFQLRRPDHFLNVGTSSLGTVLADVLKGTERVLRDEQPDAMVVLGDTNSCISALMARRMKIPVYHLEAGNRSFDPNVPEEINRHLVDHVADYNLVYSEHSRRNLLREGIHPARILHMGSPMRELLSHHRRAIDASNVLDRFHLGPQAYFLASVHREENVDNPARLRAVLDALGAVGDKYDLPVLVSTHPRTRKRVDSSGVSYSDRLQLSPPLAFADYVHLQMNSACVLSDSGTIAEESSILGFPAVTLRDAIERPEAIDTGSIITAGVQSSSVLDSIELTMKQFRAFGAPTPPSDYAIADSSRRVVNFVHSTASTHHVRTGLRGPFPQGAEPE